MASVVTGCDDATEHREPDTPKRIAILGASMSFGLLGWPLANAWHAAAPSSEITSLADVFFYQQPVVNAQTQAMLLGQTDADLVIALDYLFWLGYDSNQPLTTIEYGLAALDDVDDGQRMFVVGDIPMLEAGGFYAPNDADIVAIKARLGAWAQGRDNIAIVPFSEWAELLLSDADVSLPDGEIVPARSLMNDDELHPTALGTWYILDRVDAQLEGQFPRYAPDFARFERPQ